MTTEKGLRLGNGKYCTLRLFFLLTDINCSQRTILPFCQLLIVSPDIVSCQIYVLPAQRYGGYRALYESGRITEAACMAHARRKIHDVHARAPTDITTEALQRIGELYAIEAEVRGCSAEQRLAARKARAAPLMQSLYDWIQQQMKILSRHSDTAKAFTYLLKQWDSLNVYCSNGWMEIDNNIAENALRGVAVGRKN